MPCNEVRLIELDLPNLDQDLMDETLESLGLATTLAYRDGKLISRFRISQETLAKIKQRYAERAIEQVAAQKHWKLTKNGNHITLDR